MGRRDDSIPLGLPVVNRSPMLARILSQMEQNQKFQPQSYGALAAALGGSLLDKQSLNAEMQAQQQAQAQQNQALAQALQQARGGMQSLPGTGAQLDTLPDPNGAMQSLAASGHPVGAQLAQMQLAQALMPQQGEGFSLSPGQTRFGPGGRPIASLPPAQKEEKPPNIVTLSRGQDVQSLRDNDPRIPAMLENGWVERSTPLVQVGDGGAQFPSPPQGYYRPDKTSPGVLPEPGSPPPPERQMSGEIKAKVAMLESSNNSLTEAKNLLWKDGSFRPALLRQFYNPLRKGAAADFYNAAFEAMSNRLRAESGATITKEEVDDQLKRFMPKPWDSEQVAKNNFARFEKFIATYKETVGANQGSFMGDAPQQPAPSNTIKYDSKGNRL